MDNSRSSVQVVDRELHKVTRAHIGGWSITSDRVGGTRGEAEGGGGLREGWRLTLRHGTDN